MSDPWAFTGESPSLGHAGGTVVLVEGSAFCISGRSGDIFPGTPQGLFFRDTRLISRLEVRVNGHQPEPLAAGTGDPFNAVFVSRTHSRAGGPGTLLVYRNRYIGRGMREDIEVRNFGDEGAYCGVEVRLDVDFANLFEVKEGRAGHDTERTLEAVDRSLVFGLRRGTVHRSVRVDFTEKAQLLGSSALFEVIVPPGGRWSTCVQVTPVFDGEDVQPRYLCGDPVDEATPTERLSRWRRQTPLLETDHDDLDRAVARSVDDLGALRIFDPEFPERTVVAAGAPWFMTLFGRDSLITSWMALLADPDLALGVLQTLARFQGSDVNPITEEEPGRILHEMRFGEAATLSLGGGTVYYGTADATPLFVMLLGELRRWGLANEVVDQLMPHADRAIDWIEQFGDADGDGYVEYQRASDRGLANQGWKDSWDGIRFASGEVARPPIALCEVQGYVYAAYLARAYFAREQGDEERAARLLAKAADLKEAFNRDFWLEDRGWFAVALDRDKRPVDSLTSNMGHCLWTGIVDREKAPTVARWLLSPEMFSGWGIRTLGTSMGGYNPLSYHCGSVWPHDSALIASGLMRYGFVEEAQRVIVGLTAAAGSEGGRLPELFTGLNRSEFPGVVPYPTSCSPQAWAAASPLLFVRSLLRFDPWVPRGKLWLDPALPPEITRMRVDRIPLAGARVSVAVEDGQVEVEGLPRGLQLIREPRRPLTAEI